MVQPLGQVCVLVCDSLRSCPVLSLAYLSPWLNQQPSLGVTFKHLAMTPMMSEEAFTSEVVHGGPPTPASLYRPIVENNATDTVFSAILHSSSPKIQEATQSYPRYPSTW
jgi:hypothetical protein